MRSPGRTFKYTYWWVVAGKLGYLSEGRRVLNLLNPDLFLFPPGAEKQQNGSFAISWLHSFISGDSNLKKFS